MTNKEKHPSLVAKHMDFSQIQLIYRTEGNANLILALPQYQKVLRLPKTNIKTSDVVGCSNEFGPNKIFKAYQSSYKTANLSDNAVYEQSNNCNGNEYEIDSVSAQDIVAYIGIVRKFLEKEYVFMPEIVAISKPVDRAKIEKICNLHRPAHRLDKGFYGQYGLLLPDATLLSDMIISNFQLATTNTFAIEIKPKQGWKLPHEISIFNLRILEQSSVKCRYCAMQCVKLKNKIITRLSGYCPMDLFSGNYSRMRNALYALFECPQNNLRIFRNGSLLYGDHSESISYDDLKQKLFPEKTLDTIVYLLIQCLLRDYTTIEGVDSDINNEKTIELENSCLPRNCVLEKVLCLQMLAKKNLNFMATSLYRDWRQRTFSCIKNLVMQQTRTDFTLSKLLPAEEYLLGATALDCSIIVTFREIQNTQLDKMTSNNPNVIFLPKYDKSFITKVTVVDLDPKSDSHFFNYVKKTNDAYLNDENNI